MPCCLSPLVWGLPWANSADLSFLALKSYGKNGLSVRDCFLVHNLACLFFCFVCIYREFISLDIQDSLQKRVSSITLISHSIQRLNFLAVLFVLDFVVKCSGKPSVPSPQPLSCLFLLSSLPFLLPSFPENQVQTASSHRSLCQSTDLQCTKKVTSLFLLGDLAFLLHCKSEKTH